MVFILLLYISAACEFSIDFSQCHESTIAALITPKGCYGNKPWAIQNLPCDYECPAGERLDINLNASSLICTPCQENTYNIGGGITINSWSLHRHDFSSFCSVLIGKSWKKGANCTTWHASSDEILISGTTSINNWYAADLFLYPYLVKPGKVKLIYRREVSGQGNFFIYIDNLLQYVDMESPSYEWFTVDIPLDPGRHEIQIAFINYVTDQISEIVIKEIQIRGTEHAAYTCLPCANGKSTKGADECLHCEMGSYLDDKICKKCPYGTTSLPGSADILDCYKLKNCTVLDFHYYFSECRYGMKTKFYEWNYPLMCNNEGITLPNMYIMPCGNCPLGKFYNETYCEYCETGSFIVDSSPGKKCLECPEGKYSPKMLAFTDWGVIPDQFNTWCMSVKNTICSFGWETRGTFIITSPLYERESSIYIETTFEFIEKDSYFSYNFTKTSGTNFIVYVDGIVKDSYQNQAGGLSQHSLSPGNHTIKWLCKHSISSYEYCSLSEILFHGTRHGGSAACIPCKDGSISKGNQQMCTACNAGFTSNLNHTLCIPCPSGMVSKESSKCSLCPPGTIPDSNSEFCTLPELLVINNKTFQIQKLRGKIGNPSDYCKEDRMLKYCYGTFFGPSLHKDSIFYISFVNPSEIKMPNYAKVSNMNAYAFGIFPKNSLTLTEIEYLELEDVCSEAHDKILVNLGSELSLVNTTNLGFMLEYSNGDCCDQNKKFTTKIEFICDKYEKEGWPFFLHETNCEIVFAWPTIHACRMCSDEDLIIHKGECKDGKREIHYYESEKCVFANNTGFVKQVEKCEEESVIMSWPFLVLVLVSVVLIILVSVVSIWIFKVKHTIVLSQAKLSVRSSRAFEEINSDR
ncbi:hypothetical protein SteCoe_31596 [Stentor coeruleus]|uniref:MRH domain-containing protein n=1 Tax=Stentor coeruleus TaxID=5963 RepID=A0A1R2B168_9CILI|nr:hypothetical protein SteCoe_31596 [Stentor coeruleus]